MMQCTIQTHFGTEIQLIQSQSLSSTGFHSAHLKDDMEQSKEWSAHSAFIYSLLGTLAKGYEAVVSFIFVWLLPALHLMVIIIMQQCA